MGIIISIFTNFWLSVYSLYYGTAGPFLQHDEIASKVQRGDLIEIKRKNSSGPPYSHWVICKRIDSNGKVWCYHVCLTDLSRGRTNTRAQIKYETLEHIMNDTDNDQPSLCRINNQESNALERNIGLYLHNENLDLYFDIMFRYLDSKRNCFVDYDYRSKNCEYYATKWKYGTGWSYHINTVKQCLRLILIILCLLFFCLSLIATLIALFNIITLMYNVEIICITVCLYAITFCIYRANKWYLEKESYFFNNARNDHNCCQIYANILTNLTKTLEQPVEQDDIDYDDPHEIEESLLQKLRNWEMLPESIKIRLYDIFVDIIYPEFSN